MNIKSGTTIKLRKISEVDAPKILSEKFPIGHVVEGILIDNLVEGSPIRIVHLKHEINKQYGIFISTNVEMIEPSFDSYWTLTTRNSVYTIEEITNLPHDNHPFSN